jgi:predicted metal-dependent hydrolase
VTLNWALSLVGLLSTSAASGSTRTLEIYWHEMPPGDLRIFFHAMIQVAMAYYKLFTAPNLAGALSLLTKALEKLAVVGNVQLLQKQSDFVESLRAQHTLLMNAGKSAPRSEGIAHLPGIYAWQV